MRQAEIDGGVRPATTTEDKARMAALEKENRELRRANEILKSAAVFFGFMSPSTRVVVGDATIRVPGGLARFFGARRCRGFSSMCRSPGARDRTAWLDRSLAQPR